MDNQLKIYLDNVVFKIQKFGGASTYWKELLSNFIKMDNVNLIFQIKDKSELNDDGLYIYNRLTEKNNVIMENKLPASLLRYLPLTKRIPANSIYHNSYYRTCLQSNVVNIFTIHDFTHKRGYASKFPRKIVHIGLTYLGLINADGIICISENTKRDLMLFYPQIPEDKITVIYHGVSNDFHPIKRRFNLFRNKLSLTEPFVLFVGKRQGYKKFDIVPEAVKEIENLKLVIIGGGKLNENEEKYLDDVLPERYYKFDDVSNAELNELYNHAYSLIYTSIYEGFGIPLLEAMKAGCPVIANKLSSLPEVAGDSALLIDVIGSQQIAEMLRMLKDKNLRDRLIAKGFEQCTKFTWDKCFYKTYSFYKTIYNKKFK